MKNTLRAMSPAPFGLSPTPFGLSLSKPSPARIARALREAQGERWHTSSELSPTPFVLSPTPFGLSLSKPSPTSSLAPFDPSTSSGQAELRANGVCGAPANPKP